MNIINIPIKNIRNFAIIAHIDHGKSTLSDRIIEICEGLTQREMKQQVLDSLDVERERGITVKAQTVSLQYKYDDDIYLLNLIDTPGHVDFNNEVRRSLKACEGVLVLVDASQGVEAQTIANVYHAVDENLIILPVLNKVDLPSAQPDVVREQIFDLLGIHDDAVEISAKSGLGVKDLIHTLIEKIPSPICKITNDQKDISQKMQLTTCGENLKALLIDSWYDDYLGVVLMVRVLEGAIFTKMNIKMLQKNAFYTVESLGIFNPKKVILQKLTTGMVGFIVANIRNIQDCIIGDTITTEGSNVEPLPGFKVMSPVVFCGIYPIDADEYNELKSALEKLKLHDSSLSISSAYLPALGSGFRCGFLGLLHLEVIQERLLNEFDLQITITSPNVLYKVYTNSGEMLIDHPSSMPEMHRVEYIEEPWVNMQILVHESYIGSVIQLCEDRRGVQKELKYIQSININRVMLIYELPLANVIFDFHDKLKSLTKGYGSFEYENSEYKKGDIVPLSILIDGEREDSLAVMIHRDSARKYGQWVCATLKDSIDRQLFKVIIQAAIGGTIIARETVSPLRKDVTAKCYGGDITRKRKLLEKQKAGKKRMKEYMSGKVAIPHKAILKILRRS